VPDIPLQVEEIYASDRFWPEPLISINPRFERGACRGNGEIVKELHALSFDSLSVPAVSSVKSFFRSRLNWL
jgi:hypothetical protein